MLSIRALGFAIAGILATHAAAQQITTGQLVGAVRDESGGAIGSALVTVSSPALQGGPTSVRVSATGIFRLLFLPPGDYRLDATAPGFQGYSEERIRVQVNGTVRRLLTLPIASVTDEVTVTGRGSIVDPHRVGTTANYNSEYIENLPRPRISATDFLKMAPGISPWPAGAEVYQLSSFGSAVNENLFLVDGVNRTDVAFGGGPPSLTMDSLQEIEIVTRGVSAEFAYVQGAVFNIVTKQGSNAWRFDLSYYHQNDALTAESDKTRCRCPEVESGFVNNAYYDATANVGGPLIPNQLWLFAAYQYRYYDRTLAGMDPRFPLETPQHRLFQKLNWQATPRLSLTQTLSVESSETGQPEAGVMFPAEALVVFESGERALALTRLTYVHSDDTLFDFQISRSLAWGEAVPRSGRSTPYRFDRATDTWVEGSLFFNDWEWYRVPVNGKVTHYAEDFLNADHEFSVGMQFTHGSGKGLDGIPGGVSYDDYAGMPDTAYFNDANVYGGQVRSLGVFAEDTLQIGERVTLNLGLRFDRSKGVSQDVAAVDNLGNPTGQTVAGLGDLFTWNTWSPRLGANYRLTRDGKTVLRGSWGRFYQSVLAGQFEQFHPGSTPVTRARFDPLTGEYSDLLFTFDPLEDQGIDDAMRPPSTDQFSIGIDRELWADSVLSVSYLKKNGRNFTGWVDVGGAYGVDSETLSDGRDITVFPLVGPPSDRFLLLTNPDGWHMGYDGLLLAFDKLWSAGRQTHVSYGLSRAEGLQASNMGGRGGPQFSVPTGPFFEAGADPNDPTNAEGRLANDRTHMFRAVAVAEIPKIDVVLSGYFQFLSGRPWASATRVRLPQGTRWILLEPPGAQRFPSSSLLDLRFSKVFRFGRDQKLEVLVDVLNVFNDNAVRAVASNDPFNPRFGQPQRLVEPRRAMLGLKLAF